MTAVSSRLPPELLQTQWSKQLNQLSRIPMLQGIAINDIALVASTPTAINIKIDRKQQGWIITDNSADCTVWRTEPFNAETLTLESSANTTISLWVY